MSELEQLLSSKTTMELKLEEVMSTVPVNMSQLVKIKIGKNCNTEILSKLDSDEQEMVATMAEQLKASLELMSMDERKSVFHDCLNECSIEIQRALDNSASSRANFNWVPHDLSHELLSIVTDKWDQARSLYQNFLDEDKSRQRKWTAVSEDISREFTPGATSQPELEHDSLEEKKLGWNREWTWRRRAQFNWGVETLMSGLETKDEFHTEARRRIELLSNHIPVVEGCKQALKSVIDAFWNITSDRAPRAYQHSIAGAIDNKQNFIKELSSDVEYIEKELAMVHNGNLQQRKNFEDTEVTGGTAMVALLAEYKTLNQQLTSLPIEKEEAIVEPTSRLADLKNQREEEVQRALKKSQDYLSENMQLQNECKEQLEKIEAKFKQREADVESKIRDNEDKQRLAEEEHHKQAVKRLDNEAKRCEVIKQLITDAEELIQRYKKTIETNEAELSYPKATLIPFSHSFTLTLLNCQRDYLVGLSDYEDIVPNHMIELIKPSFVLRSRLCSSLIQACNDIDEVLEACKVQIEFCNGLHYLLFCHFNQ